MNNWLGTRKDLSIDYHLPNAVFSVEVKTLVSLERQQSSFSSNFSACLTVYQTVASI